MNSVPYIIAAALIASAPASAKDSAIAGSVTFETGYVFEAQAFVLSKKPVMNAELDWKQSKNFSAYVWAQKGENGTGATEIDVVQTFNFNLGAGEAHGKLGVYMQPLDGVNAIYTAHIGASFPITAGFVVGGDVQAYAGALKTTNFKVGVSHQIMLGKLPASVTVGHAWNTAQLAGINPWYGIVSLPLGKTGIELGAHGFMGHGNGGAMSITYHFGK